MSYWARGLGECPITGTKSMKLKTLAFGNPRSVSGKKHDRNPEGLREPVIIRDRTVVPEIIWHQFRECPS